MRTKTKNTTSIVLLILALASLALPMMSGYCADGESGTILARIFNLPEFSPLGSVTLIVPLLLIAVALLRFPLKWKRLTVIGIVIADAVCTTISCINAYAWFSEIGMESVSLHPISIAYIATTASAVLLLLLHDNSETINSMRATPECVIYNSGLYAALSERLKTLHEQEQEMKQMLELYDELVASGEKPDEETVKVFERIRKIVGSSDKENADVTQK